MPQCRSAASYQYFNSLYLSILPTRQHANSHFKYLVALLHENVRYYMEGYTHPYTLDILEDAETECTLHAARLTIRQEDNKMTK